MPGFAPLVLQALAFSAASGADGEACTAAETCEASAPAVKEVPPLSFLVEAFGCGAAGFNGTVLDCLFSALYPARAGHGTVYAAREMTYGELRPEAFAALLGGEGLVGVPAESQDSFVDLGSGTGKLAIQAFLHGVHDSRGVELAEDRHGLGAAALELLHEKLADSRSETSAGLAQLSLPAGGAAVALARGDMLQQGLAATTSVAFAASLCFPEALLAGLAAKLREELPPGALFWSLRELPAGEHDGLALVARLPVLSTWSSKTRLLVYIRTPAMELRPPAHLSPQLAAASLLDGAREAFARLAASLGAEGGGDQELAGDRELPAAALAALGARTSLAAVRLLRAFGTPRRRSREDPCGCASPSSGPTSWSVMPADFAGMLGHGAWLQNSSQLSCLSLAQACTLGDLVAAAIFESWRKVVRCRGASSGAYCSTVSEEDDTASRARALEGWPCVRSSDGRSLLQAALFRDRPELGELALEAAGNASLACVDHEGQTSVHAAVQHSSSATLEWLLRRLAARGDRGREELRAADAWGRTPVASVRQAAALRVLQAAGGLGEDGLNSRDASGRAPLAQAILRGDEELAKALLELRADASSTGSSDSDPLMLAVRKRAGVGARLAHLLAAHGADVHARHGAARTAPMHVAASHGGAETVRALLELGAEPAAEAAHGLRPEDLATEPDVLALLRGRRPESQARGAGEER